MDLFGILLKTKNGNIFILVIIDHHSSCVKLIALKKAKVAEVVLALRAIWMPKHGIPATLLSDNGPQLTASDVQYFGKGVGARRIYKHSLPSTGQFGR